MQPLDGVEIEINQVLYIDNFIPYIENKHLH